MAGIQTILGNNVRQLRTKKGWSQLFLADKLDVSVSFISIIESGQRGVSLPLVEDIASVFNVPIPYLFTDHDAAATPAAAPDLDALKAGLADYIDSFFARR